MRSGWRWLIVHFAIIAVMSGCGWRTRRPSIGEAYVAPIQLNLLEEVAPRAPVTASVRHGERLEVLERRRRFLKVRTVDGVEGWAESTQLLSKSAMDLLRRLHDEGSRIPSQGVALPFDLLNVHTDAHRLAPTFYQIAADETVEVLGRKVTPRGPWDPEKPASPDPASTAIKDDWSLVRLKDGRCGWALSRMLLMNLPDDVAQFAAGDRITSYFSLGPVTRGGPRGGEETDHQMWLWTTITGPPESYHFDKIRVSAWNQRRRQYETVYFERGMTGFYPVTIEQDPDTPSFRIITGSLDGPDRFVSSYRVEGRRARLIARSALPATPAPAPKSATQSQWWTSLRDRWLQWRTPAQ